MTTRLLLLAFLVSLPGMAQAQRGLFSKGGGGKTILTVLNPIPKSVEVADAKSEYLSVVKDSIPDVRAQKYDELTNFPHDVYSTPVEFSYAMDYDEKYTRRSAHVDIAIVMVPNGQRANFPGKHVLYTVYAKTVKASWATSVEVGVKTLAVHNVGTREFPVQQKVVDIVTTVTFKGITDRVVENHKVFVVTADGTYREVN